MNKYFTILTSVGEAKLANATALGETVKLTELALGDGDGSLPTPKQSQTALVNEVRRKALNSVAVDENNPNWIMCEQVIPEDVGGWTIREVGIYDEDGDLIAVGNFPETYKPVLEEGSGRTQTIRVVLQISSTSSVELKIDPSVVLATREYVDKQDKAHLDDSDPHPQYATDDDLSQAMQQAATDFSNLVAVSQFLPYDANRTYKTGETCTTWTNGEVKVWQMYAGPNLTCKGKNPTDPLNRHEQWPNAPEPWWWVPYTGNTPGQMSGWLSDAIPEEAVLENEVDLNAKMYWRLAARWPELVSGVGDSAIINTRDILGRYVRTADGSNYLLNQTHEDAIRNITASFYTNNGWMFTATSGAMGRFGSQQSMANATTTAGASLVAPAVDFDASRVVPTASQNQPITTIENKIVFV